MEQITPQLFIAPPVAIKPKADPMQRFVLSVFMVCAFVAALNFTILFNIGAIKVAAAINQQTLQKSGKFIINQTRDYPLQLSINRELNNLQNYTTGQRNQKWLYLNVTNNTTSTITIRNIRFLAYVDGAYGTSSTSSMNFTPSYSRRDGGASASLLVTNIALQKYNNGQYQTLSTSSLPISPQGYVNFNNLSLTMAPTTTPVIIVIKGDVSNRAPYGQEPDALAFDLANANDLVAYNQFNQLIPAGPSGVNGSTTPTVFHPVAFPNNPPLTPNYFNAAASSTHAILLSWQNVLNESGYKIWRSQTPTTFPSSTIAIIGPNIYSYLDAGLATSTRYYYKLIAFNQYGDSPPIYTGGSTW